ncbi:hypothetical protein BDV29DRAFT_174908 [Aspergillus leporis]|uniref:Uncharacterized protein n=1 Tax=Aspergillus leporis TaxID=41062 RepID=A0A5N5WZ34_9EURO|nr:hypothetical protein BDV29DRAFT_174908 [Aspergillus leporis]
MTSSFAKLCGCGFLCLLVFQQVVYCKEVLFHRTVGFSIFVTDSLIWLIFIVETSIVQVQRC